MTPDSWSVVDFWRSYWAALAMEHGDDPDVAAERHRRWCIDMGIEPMAEHDDRCREYYAAEYDSTPEMWDRLGTVHSGDCTGDAWTCDACVREDVERAAVAQFMAAGALR